ncbi:Mechanosensitive ion channel [Cyclonatronum proteinivorum]|uniref:Mechanosensitive ion channel n=1 Tax=Cyclonatronum proteinivorum TaxID=1457365 RepID=A0A345UIQ9_9BACT|nr:mechanosensitive ion channel family protein [Cyclonatronum proteinivorum]AXJ00361.1 Mechanosensitive ion channel [Cyclonatronum proteinivorum]
MEFWNYTLNVEVLIRVSVLVFVGIPLLGLIRKWVRTFVSEKYSPHYAMLFSKIVFYVGFIMVVVLVLHEFGFSLGPLLGAAGILGIGISFASQTSLSNIISGFFLIGEKPFQVGDIVKVNDIVGVVMSIDTLSVKIRVFDNHLVRIPNETMLKSPVTNFTRFPIRRASIKVSVAYKEDLDRVRKVLTDIVDDNPYALQEPAAAIHFDSFNNSSVDLNLRVWSQKDDFISMLTSINLEIKKRFDAFGIEIPFPHVTVYTGDVTKPFPIAMQEERIADTDKLPPKKD